MSRVLVWDLPVRVFHWLLAVGFVGAAVIALGLGEHSPLFPYHSIIGLTLALLVALRIIWGFIGTRYARFASFAFGPGAVLRYFKGALLGGDKPHVGHNPGSAYAIFAMLLILIGLAVTGVMLGRGNEGVKEVHEILAYAMIAVAGAHILGVILHTLRYRDPIALSMLHGRKKAEAASAIPSAQPFAAFVLVALTVGWFGGLVRSYDSVAQSARIPLLGVSLQLGEAEREGGGEGEEHEGEDED